MKPKYKSIFISDFHLGSARCKADFLLTFLKQNSSENLFLVGDIIDGWRLKSNWYWPESHSKIVKKIFKIADKDTKVIYILGNHDEFMREWLPMIPNIGKLTILNEYEYTAINGKKYLIVHGDMFDALMRVNAGKFLMHLGDKLYDILIKINNWWSKIRSLLRLPYWSLSKWLKQNTKKVVGHVAGFETLLTDYCKSKKFDGIVCGHIHTPAYHIINNVEYINVGDWIESCSAVVEHWDGTFELIHFIDYLR